MTTFQQTLSRLFTRNVVVTKRPGKRLKTFDVNKTQSTGSPDPQNAKARWRNGRSPASFSGWGSSFVNHEIEALRKMLYLDYELMDTDGIVTSALDITADECLGFSTKIPLLDGRILTIKELYDLQEKNFWLYGLDDTGKFIPVQADKVIYKGIHPCVKITLDDNTEIICTKEHKWINSQLEHIETNKLNLHDSLYVLKTKYNNTKHMKDYQMIETTVNKYDFVHRLVARSVNIKNSEIKSTLSKPVIHHTSFNKHNNSPDYLEWLGWQEHTKVHTDVNKKMWEDRRGNEQWMEYFRSTIKQRDINYWTPERRAVHSKAQQIKLNEYFATLSPEERTKKYGRPGKLNGMFGVDRSLSKNTNWNPNLDRIEDIDINDVIITIIEEKIYKNISLFNVLNKYYTLNKKQFFKITKEICKIFDIPKIDKIYEKWFELYVESNFITDLRELIKINPKITLTDVAEKYNVFPVIITRSLVKHGYKHFNDFKQSQNHKIIRIEDIGLQEVYDIVNAGDNHLFAIETNDGSKLYTHNCTSNSESGELLIIHSEDNEIKKILHNLFYDIMNIEFNMWHWFRQMAKYGDFFLYLEIREKFGVINVLPIHPSLMVREEGTREDPNEVKFRYEGDGQNYSNQSTFNQYEIAHFRLITDTNFLPYGRSSLEGARKDYKSMKLMEDAMLLHRIMRAPERRIIKIDVGNIPPNEIESHMEQIISEMKKIPYIDPSTGEINLKYNLLNSQEDYYLPVRGGQSGTSIETLPGLGNDGQIDDVEYFKSKMMAALKIPKAYLGYDESSAKTALSAEDIRFAKMIERYQKIFVSELYKIAIVHLHSQGHKDEDLLGFELSLTSPSIIYERQKIDLLNEKFNLIANILESNLLSDIYIYENILGLSESEWKQEKLRLPNFLKEKFRYTQITEEGNDPKVTGKTFGTPHDIASMQVASKFNATDGESLEKLYSPDERENNEGQPYKYKSFETVKDKAFGRDPLGRRELDKGVKENIVNSITKQMTKNTKQSLNEEVTTDLELNMLNESQILDQEL
jgi:Bacteriophage T4-like portal protein (Gp20)